VVAFDPGTVIGLYRTEGTVLGISIAAHSLWLPIILRTVSDIVVYVATQLLQGDLIIVVCKELLIDCRRWYLPFPKYSVSLQRATQLQFRVKYATFRTTMWFPSYSQAPLPSVPD
jgi:hypothetical protein